KTGEKVIIGECKFRNEQFDKAEFETMLSRRAIFPFAKETAFYAFSKSGFSNWVHENAAAASVTLVEISDLFQI
ncbi:MAG: ATP-binding protein, partial [Treponema sp.]|nr:ATP-binding protein [Treponema sp.]